MIVTNKVECINEYLVRLHVQRMRAGALTEIGNVSNFLFSF